MHGDRTKLKHGAFFDCHIFFLLEGYYTGSNLYSQYYFLLLCKKRHRGWGKNIHLS